MSGAVENTTTKTQLKTYTDSMLGFKVHQTTAKRVLQKCLKKLEKPLTSTSNNSYNFVLISFFFFIFDQIFITVTSISDADKRLITQVFPRWWNLASGSGFLVFSPSFGGRISLPFVSRLAFRSSLLLFSTLFFFYLHIFFLDEGDESVTTALQFHSCPGLDEPVKSELGSVSDTLPEFLVNILLVETHLMQHTYQEAVLFLSVVLPFIGPVLYP